MTIKIKAPVIWLDADSIKSGLSVRVCLTEHKYRAVSESDWRKLMRLVREVEDTPEKFMTIYVRDALAALEPKK